MNSVRFSLLFALAGCLPGTFPSIAPDQDGDGYTVGDLDCDDTNAAVNPATVWFEDVDGDGHGDAASSVTQCDSPSGYVLSKLDCDDANPDIRPEAVETCDAVDEDCDGVVDNGAPGSDKYYTDGDGDGFGDDASITFSCNVLPDRVTLGGDCDDANKEANPDAIEVCDGTDNDCNKLADDEPPDGAKWFVDVDEDGFGGTEIDLFCDDPGAGYAAVSGDCDDADKTVPDFLVWYSDLDKDGYGDDLAVAKACSVPVDHVAKCGDCLDTDQTIHPNADEVCDSIDQDCDEDIDDNPTNPTPWYLDADEDTYGAGTATSACDAPTDKYVDRAGDCKDLDAAYHPGAPEACTDSVDFNCDGAIGLVDNDGDGFAACKECNDNIFAINPGATEICDAANVDENCNSAADDADSGVSDATRSTWYYDGDADTYGLTSKSERACDKPSDYVVALGDCNDVVSSVNPGAPEICDALDADEDCDGKADDLDTAPSGRTAYYADVDLDSHGDATDALDLCDAVVGRVVSKDDCNDTKANIHPGAAEVCDAANVDEDCLNLADDLDPSVSDASRTDWYYDGDKDTYGLTTKSERKCDAPTDYVTASGDCDDVLGTINPGATEIVGDEADSNCNSAELCWQDDDDDGFRHATATVTSADLDCVDAKEGRTVEPLDCSTGTVDNDVAINPGATEIVGDEADSNCNSTELCWQDDDDDGFRHATATVTSADLDCVDAKEGRTVDPLDCSTGTVDNDVAINPGATEVCDVANVDEDCDGTSDDLDVSATGKTPRYRDVDGDTHGNALDSVALCDVVAGRVSIQDDCNDADANLYPGAPELCDGVVDDCSVGWLLSDEDGVVTHFPPVGTANDLTTAWALGGKNSIASITLPTSGSVSVCAGTYYVALTAPSGTLTLSGAGATTTKLDGEGGTSRVLTVAAPASVTVSDLTLTHGAGGALILGDAGFTDTQFIANAAGLDDGGGLSIGSTSVVTLDTCTIDQNTASRGAGIWASGASVDLTETVVSNNVATTFGGGLYLHDTAMSCTRTTVGGVFANTASGGPGSGGGAYIEGTLDLTSDGCDWGVPFVDDNVSEDLFLLGTGALGPYGANATFDCSGTSCI